MLAGWADQHGDRVGFVRPDGGVVAFTLLRGTCFGRPGHVRLGFGVPPDELAAGLGAISELLG